MLAFAPSTFLGSSSGILSPVALRAPRKPSRAQYSMSAKVLILNTKGAGHGFIGLHLARTLLDSGNDVDLLQVGGSDSSGPFSKYSTLSEQYPSKFSFSFGDVSSASTAGYDAVYDNNAKSAEDAAPAIAAGKAGAEVFYVASAGAYSYNPNLAPHIVGDAAKGATVDVEDLFRAEGVSSVNFRPIYIVGEDCSKREYLDYFFDRIVRGRPLPLPGNGSELTSLTDVRDIASMLAAALGRGFKNETLNLVNSRAVTFDGVVKMCEEACGKKANVVRYDPAEVKKKMPDFVPKKAFPFRPRHFFADPGEATQKLGWTAEFSGSADKLAAVIKSSYEDYVAMGLDKKDMDFPLDDEILRCVS